MVKIEFFNEGKSLGAFPLKDHSHHEDRVKVAEVNQIGEFDRYILDDEREAYRSGEFFYQYKNELWIVDKC